MASLIALASILLASVIAFVFIFHARLRKQKRQLAATKAAKAGDDPLCKELLSKTDSMSNYSTIIPAPDDDDQHQRP